MLAVFLSTLQPMNYYKTLITQGVGETMVIKSPFDQHRLKLIIDPTISTRYQDRSDSISEVVLRIRAVLDSRKGNYIVFFPSYQYLDMAKEALLPIDADLIVQTRDMSFAMRDQIMDRFSLILMKNHF